MSDALSNPVLGGDFEPPYVEDSEVTTREKIRVWAHSLAKRFAEAESDAGGPNIHGRVCVPLFTADETTPIDSLAALWRLPPIVSDELTRKGLVLISMCPAMFPSEERDAFPCHHEGQIGWIIEYSSAEGAKNLVASSGEDNPTVQAGMMAIHVAQKLRG